jgi:hypothetical protein
MLINFFDYFLPSEGQYPERRIWKVIISSLICYGILFIIIKNLIYYEKITENIYWFLLFVFLTDIFISLNRHKEYIETKLKHLFLKKKYNSEKKIKEIIEEPIQLDKKLLDEEEYTTSIIV